MLEDLLRIPTLSHINEGLVYLQNEKVSKPYTFEVSDIEGKEVEQISSILSELTKNLSPNERFGFKLEKRASKDDVFSNNLRGKSISDLGYTTYKGHFFIDRALSKKGFLFRSVEPVASKLDLSRLEKCLKLRGLIDSEVNEEFSFFEKRITNCGTFLDFGDRLIGAVRVYKQSDDMTLFEMAKMIADLPTGIQMFTGVEAISGSRAEVSLRMLKNRQSGFGDVSKIEKVSAIDNAINELSINNEVLVNLEQIILVEAINENELRQKLQKVSSIMSQAGDVMIETDGLPQTFFATRMGGVSHHSFIDISKNIASFLPIVAFKSDDSHIGEVDRSLILQRTDDSLTFLDIFNKKFLAFNGLIVGKTGSGKSVFANLLTESLLQDPKIQIIKVDVGGSYKKECEYVGGLEVNFSIDSPSGLNPFFHANSLRESRAYSEFLTHFICEVIKESVEQEVSKDLRAKVENGVLKYLASFEGQPSLTGFVNSLVDFERVDLLKRWAKGGLFEHVFSGNPLAFSNKYTYFNFSSIQGAGSKDFAQAVMAAVILEVNVKLLIAGDRFSNPDGSRIALFCDETKFFLERNLEFFLFTTANFRKFGHSIFLINQDIKNFEVKRPDGSSDKSLIINSPIRIFLQADYEEKQLREEFFFSGYQINSLVKNPYRGKDYRELVIQDDLCTRVCRLRLTREEYYKASSSTQDNEKISLLMKHIPGLKFREAIQCVMLTE